ncbi:Uncharacterised protein [Mycobacteroides abscessus subsp. abscessus]|nr:Uncharacterised protein [Mycobacteroides abscessus subsp. abscessus]
MRFSSLASLPSLASSLVQAACSASRCCTVSGSRVPSSLSTSFMCRSDSGASSAIDFAHACASARVPMRLAKPKA